LRESIDDDGSSILTVKTKTSVAASERSFSQKCFSFDTELANSEAYKRTYDRLSKRISKETIRSPAPAPAQKGATVDDHNEDIEFYKFILGAFASGQANEIFDDGMTPLLVAAREGFSETVEVLLRGGADPNYTNQSTPESGVAALHYAAVKHYPEMVTSLLKFGAKVDLQATEIGTPLSCATAYNHLDICRLLLEAGADPHAIGRFQDRTPLHNAIYNGDRDALMLLLEFGAKAEAKDGAGLTALDCAIEQHQTDVLRELLRSLKSRGILHQELESKRDLPLTSLQKALAARFPPIVSLLIEWGADPTDCMWCLRQSEHEHTDTNTRLIEVAITNWEKKNGSERQRKRKSMKIPSMFRNA
jgi:ankyrin repeat protein